MYILIWRVLSCALPSCRSNDEKGIKKEGETVSLNTSGIVFVASILIKIRDRLCLRHAVPTQPKFCRREIAMQVLQKEGHGRKNCQGNPI